MSQKTDKNQSLDTLKDLLFKDEKQKLQEIENRLDDPGIRAEEISQVLPEAISLSNLRNHKISGVLQPVIDDSIKISVKNNPKALADAIAPALGPGIRRAITSTIMGMIQSLNQVLNHSFSIQGIRWRFEAFRTRKQFAEIVLLHTLVYQVEQIFLIHRQTGLVLEHVVAGDTIIQDPDLVSGMLTAIQDFVKDSFHTDSDDDLETLRIGSHRSVWIETGEYAMIAAVIRGTPPVDLRRRYREMIEEIHIKSGRALIEFDGDPLFFSIFRQDLKDGLRFKEKKTKKRKSYFFWIIILGALFWACFQGFTLYKTHKVWHLYLNQLKNQKGIIILSTKKKDDNYHIYGLRDPMAKKISKLPFGPENKRLPVQTHWKPFYSLDPEFIFKRAHHLLAPPSTITLDLSKNILVARGRASQAWIRKFEHTAASIPGIIAFKDDQIQNIDQENLKIAAKKLMGIRLYFKTNSTSFIEGQKKILAQAVQIIRRILNIQSEFNSPVQIIIMGHTDSSGSEKLNLTLSRNRAQKILNHLIINGINPACFTLAGISTRIPLAQENNLDNRQYNRAVTFKIFYDVLKKEDPKK